MARGGRREGSGRPKGKGSKIVRVPLGCLARVEAIIEIYKNDKSEPIKIKGHSPFVESKYNEVSQLTQVEKKKDERYLDVLPPAGKTLDISSLKAVKRSVYEKMSRKQKRIIESRVKKGKCRVN